MTTPNARGILPAEATVEMTQGAIDAEIFLNMSHAGWAQDSTAFALASVMAEGFAAMRVRLEELAIKS